jgi:S1-C subfamily serine protease
MRYMHLFVVLASFVMLCSPGHTEPQPEQLLKAITRVRAVIPDTAYTARSLGTEREGSGVVIDTDGHVLTIGYLILEAETINIVGADDEVVRATFVGYDHHSGFGLVRTTTPLAVQPMPLGQSAAINVGDPVLIAGYGGTEAVQGGLVVARQEFAGYWEYLLEDAIFTTPPSQHFGGAALIDRTGRLVGIGSLFTPVELPTGDVVPGNMFVPIDRLKPILAELIARGRAAAPPKPWLGLHAVEAHGRVFVRRTLAESPAARAGLAPGDIILKVGQQEVQGLADFYRQVWAVGAAGVPIPLSVLHGTRISDVTVHSADRYQYLKMPQR